MVRSTKFRTLAHRKYPGNFILKGTAFNRPGIASNFIANKGKENECITSVDEIRTRISVFNRQSYRIIMFLTNGFSPVSKI